MRGLREVSRYVSPIILILLITSTCIGALATTYVAAVFAELKHPYFIAETNTSSIGPGWTTITVKITNIGGRAEQVEVIPGQVTGIEIQASRKFYDAVEPNKTVVYIFRARPVAPGQAVVQLLVKYLDPVDDSYRVAQFQLVFVARTGNVQLVAAVFHENDVFRIRVYNVGTVDAVNVSLKLVSWSGIETRPVSKAISRLPVGGYVDLVVRGRPLLSISGQLQALQIVFGVQATYYDPGLDSWRTILLQAQTPLVPTTPQFVYKASPAVIEPGTCRTVTVYLYNIGGGSAENVTISYLTQPPLMLEDVEPTYVNLVEPGSKLLLKAKVCAPLEASSVSSVLNVKLEYVTEYSLKGIYTVQVPVSVPRVVSRVVAFFEPDWVEVPEAECKVVTLRITNHGDTPVDIVSVGLQSLQTVVAQLLGNVEGVLEPGESASVQVRVCGPGQIAAPVNAPILARVVYRGAGGGGEASAMLVAHVVKLPEPVFVASCKPSTVQPGIAEITMTIRSDVELKRVQVKVAAQQLGIYAEAYSENTSSVSIPVHVSVPSQLEGQNLALAATISYVDVYGRRGVGNAGCSVAIVGKPSLEPVSVTVAPEKVSPGDVVAISVLLANRGTGQALDLVASIEPPKGFTVIGERSTFIGRLVEGQTTILSYTLKAESNVQSGIYTIPIKLSYYDMLHRSHTVELKVNVTVVKSSAPSFMQVESTGQQSSGSATARNEMALYLLVAVAALAVVASIMYYWKSGRG